MTMATLKELYTTLKSLRDMNLPVDEKLLKAADNLEEKIIKEAYQNGVSLEELHVKFKTEEDVKRDVICCFKYDNANNVVTFFYGKDIGIATNIFFVNSRNGSPAIKKLIEELNELYNKIISLGGEKYAEILL